MDLPSLQIVVTNSLPQAANIALMGGKLEVIDISGQLTPITALVVLEMLLKLKMLLKTLTFI